MSVERAPRGLGPAGRDLWRRVMTNFEFDPHEVPGLVLACRQLDDVANLERLVAAEGMVATGSTGQPRVSGFI